MEGVLAMKQAVSGDEVSFRGNCAYVRFKVPLNCDPDSYFEKAKQDYLKRREELRQQLNG